MDNALAVLGFYFTLIGFINGLFFTRLDSWHGKVREFWGSARMLEKDPQRLEKSKTARLTLNGLAESAPKGSFIAVGIFTTSLTLLSLAIPFENPPVNPWLFLRLPLIATILLYWAGGAILLRKGSQLLKQVKATIEQVLPAQP
ncbi:MAG: hypothetical protein AB1453_04420 [Chloroflexota bacterium]|jgi:hypothetical protein